MKHRITTISILVTLACILSISVPSVVSAQAEAPEWQKGDKWAIGSEYDLTPALQDVQSNLEDFLSGADVTLTRFDVEGTGASWLLWEVNDVTDSEYKVTIRTGAKMAAELHVAVEGQLPAAGTYDVGNTVIWLLSGMPGVPKQQKEINLDFDEDFAIFSRGELTLEKDTLAIKSINWQIKSSSIIDFDARNIPSLETGDNNVTISYNNYDVSVRFNLNANFDVEFEPYLDVYQFPFDVGDRWSVDSTAVVSGTVDGFLDIQGLPDDVKGKIFSEEFIEETGITDFPIEFDKIAIENEDFNLHNGIIESFEIPIHLDLHCLEKKSIQLGNFGSIEVYVIEVNDGRQRIYYSNGIKFLAKATTELSFVDLPSEIPYDPFQGTELEVNLADADIAESQLEQIESYEASISEEITGGGSGALSNWAALLVIAIVIAVVFIVVLIVSTRRKKR